MDKAFDAVLQSEVDAIDIAKMSYRFLGERFRYQCLWCGQEVYLAAAESSERSPHFRHKKGKQLYMNYFQFEDHVRIERAIKDYVKCDWIITYDDVSAIESIYKGYSMRLYDLNYSVSSKCKASELMIFKEGIKVPYDEELQKQKININIRLCDV